MSENIIIIHRPTLTAEEHTRRMEEIKKAAVKLYIATEKAKARKETQR